MNKRAKLVCLGLCYALNGAVCCGTQANNYTTVLSDNSCDVLNNKKTNSNKIFVQDANTLAIAVSNSKAGEKIILNDNINLDRNIEIKNSISIDLNGYKIKLMNGSKIIVGEKIFDHIEHKTVHHPGHHVPNYTTKYVEQDDRKTKKITKKSWVWEPGWNETISEKIYRYLDELDVVFENGEIHGSDGKYGEHGKPYTFFSCFGKPGSSGVAAIDIVSGTVRTRNMTITGGNGGNGGNGATQTIVHIPFISGNAGWGGNGGRAGAAVILRRKECNLNPEKNSIITSGLPGLGGIGGIANTNHWIGHGDNGENGKIGKTSEAIYKKYEH